MTQAVPRWKTVHSPARVAALRALSLHDGSADAAFDRLTRLAVHALGARAALVNIVDVDRQVTRSACGAPEHYRRGDQAPLEHSMCAIAVEQGTSLVVDDGRANEHMSAMPCVAEGTMAYAGIPLVLSSGHALGALCVVSDTPRQWTPDEIGLLSDLAKSVTTELELIAAARDAEARAEAEASAMRLQAVQRITDVALTQASLTATLDAILGEVRDILAADFAVAMLLDESARHLEVRATVGVEVAPNAAVALGEGIAGRIAALREPAVVRDVASSGLPVRATRAQVATLMGAPLLHDDQLLGVILVGACERHSFEEADVRLLMLAAGRIAAAIDRARLYDAERRAREAAEAASRAKSEFLAVMSHELRTPLNAITGYTQLLRAAIIGQVNAEQDAMLERVGCCARNLTDLIGDLLQYVEIERNAPSVVGGSMPLVAMLEEVAGWGRERGGAKAVEVTLSLRGVEQVRAPDALRDILHRVLDNAIKFGPAGGRVRLEGCADTEMVRVTVSDEGAGIPVELRERVFTPFGRVDSSYRRNHDGAGMGLALSRAKARQLGGDLSIVDAESGTVIEVRVARRAPASPSAPGER